MDLNPIRAKIESLERLSAPPASLDRILELTADAETELGALGAAVDADPSLAARLLRLANSAYFGFARKIETIDDALVVLGFQRVRNLAVCVAVAPLFESHEKLDLETLWLHSCAVAEAARLVAERTSFEPGVAYAAGLMHDLGRVALADVLPQRYARVVAHDERHGCGALEAERKVLGLDHGWAAGVLFERWQLPERLTVGMACHHEPERDPSGLAWRLYLANELASLEGFPAPGDGPAVQQIPASALGALGLEHEDAERLAEAFRERGESIEVLYRMSLSGAP